MSKPFPFFQYASTLGIQSSLLLFTAFFLPRTSLLYFDSPAEFPFAQAASSLDRPQAAFLEPLTASPALTLGWICGGSCILVLWWARWVRSWAYDDVRHGSKNSEFEAKTERMEWQKRSSAEFREAVVATVLASLFYHALIVIFGAEISSHVLETYLLALQLSVLTVLPSAYVLGAPSVKMFSRSSSKFLTLRLTWTRIFAELSPKNAIERAVLYPVVGTVIGCWMGCIPIGLDWDRPWQAWPLTPAYGCIVGHVLGSLSAIVTSSVLSLAEQGKEAMVSDSEAGKLKVKAGKGKVKAQ